MGMENTMTKSNKPKNRKNMKTGQLKDENRLFVNYMKTAGPQPEDYLMVKMYGRFVPVSQMESFFAMLERFCNRVDDGSGPRMWALK